MALLLVASVALVVMGYGQADPVIWWGRQASWVGVSSVLVCLGFYCVVGARVSGIIRHPQLTSAMLWAVAHLLVNYWSTVTSRQRCSSAVYCSGQW